MTQRLLLLHNRGVLRRATAYWDARYYSGSGPLLDINGRGHNAQLGSGAGADANDPLFLPWVGTNYLHLPGVSTSRAATNDHARLDIIGDLDIECRVAATDWTPAAINALVAKWLSGGGNRSYKLSLNTNGTLSLQWTTDGQNGTLITKNSTVATGVTDGEIKWVRATLDVDNGAGGYTVQFFTSDDGTSWSQLGADVVTGGGATSIYAGTAQLIVGVDNGTNPLTGGVYQARVYNGIAGTLVFDFNPSKSYTVDQAASAAIAIGRAASGAKSVEVTRPVFLLFTDDYFEVADHPDLDFGISESLTPFWVGRVYGTTADQALLAKKADLTTAAGYSLDRGTNNAAEFTIADGAADDVDVGPALTQGVYSVVLGERDVVKDEIQTFLNGVGSGSPTTDSTTVTLANAGVLRCGRLAGAGTNYLDGEVLGFGLIRGVVTAADKLALNWEWGL